MKNKFCLILFALLWANLSAMAQNAISGKILNQADNAPIAGASVFLDNTSIGSTTSAGGDFILKNLVSGKYVLVISMVGFETYKQQVVLNNSLKLPDITLVPKINTLAEVTIKVKHDPNRARHYDLFKEQFLGTSYIARECVIANPEIIDMDYDDATSTLTASSADFIVIENPVLGYRIKYLLSDFTLDLKDNVDTVLFKGSVLYEDMKGSSGQEKRWHRNRQEVYENSAIHFLRSAAGNRIENEGFRVFKVIAERPSDSLVTRKSKSSKPSLRVIRESLKQQDIIKETNQPGLYDLFSANGAALYVSYNKDHHFRTNDRLDYLDDSRNTENSLISFKLPDATFYKNGSLTDPYSLSYDGIWGRNRLADILPANYEPINLSNTSDDSTSAEKVIAKLKNFAEQHVTEKAYLQFDKPYYATGDTIYFKAYVTMGAEHKLSDMSVVLHVDLVNTTNKIDQSIKLQLTDGVGWGDFALPDSLPKGNYRIRAYTQWMRNDGNAAYFDQNIPVGSIHNNKIPESAMPNPYTANAKPDIQLLPEGGQIVTGILSKIAFKATDGNGWGIDVKGILIDNENKEVLAFASAHLGMGCFYFTPQPGKTYRAKLSFADGTQQTVDLPKAEDKGIVLSINNDSIPKATVRIEASKDYFQENKGKDFTLMVYSGNVANTVYCTLDSALITLDILKRRLRTGVATVTLFSPSGEPLCERLLFVQNYDQLGLAINSDKTEYAAREKATISLNVKNRADLPSAGHFSVSVIDESKVPVNENTESTILSNLLLTSDLKGFVEQPNYYFNDISQKTTADLDLVMLTHGYRKFEWKQLLDNSYPPVAYQPEKGLEITGTAKNLFGKPLAKGTISLISKQSGGFATTITDNNGRFSFSNLVFTDTAKFILQATSAKGKDNAKLIYDRDAPAPAVKVWPGKKQGDVSQSLATYMANSRLQQDDIAKYGKFNGKMLKGVTIKDTKPVVFSRSSVNLVSKEFADQVITTDQMAKGGPFSERIQGALHGIYIKKIPGGVGSYAVIQGVKGLPMRIIVDGADASPDLDEILADDVESVEVLKFISSAGAYSGFASPGTFGILIINTKKNKGLDPKDVVAVGILPIAPKGFYKAREFYSPKYNTTLANNRPDLRSTIYWNPELVTDKDGNASFNYFNADAHGTYRMVIEGLDEKGNIGRQVYRYKVD